MIVGTSRCAECVEQREPHGSSGVTVHDVEAGTCQLEGAAAAGPRRDDVPAPAHQGFLAERRYDVVTVVLLRVGGRYLEQPQRCESTVAALRHGTPWEQDCAAGSISLRSSL
jgi:hypothetical protein